MKVQFEYPLSNSKVWEGRLKVTAMVHGDDAEIQQIMHEDKSGRRSNITYLMEQWCDSLYNNLCEAAINNASNLNHPEFEDVTMDLQ